MRRAWTILGVLAVTMVGACRLDDIAGRTTVIGDPLLDLTLGPSGDAGFPAGTYSLTTAAARDTMTITLTNLAPLGDGTSYKFYLVDSAAAGTAGSANVTPVSARVIRSTPTRRPVNRDESVFGTRVDTFASLDALTDVDTASTYVLRVADARIAQHTHVVLAVTGNGVAAPPTHLEGDTRFGFLWTRYRNAATNAFTNTGSFTFGSFAINSAKRLAFSTAAAAIQGSFRGPTLRLNVRDLVRPPQGFQYAVWLVDLRTGISTRVGGLLTPVPENASLDDADVGTGAYLTDVAILQAQVRGDTASAGNIRWEDFTNLTLQLEPKGATPPDEPSGINVLGGTIPPSVATRSPAPGKLFGNVVSLSGGSASGATVYLTGTTSSAPLQVTNADATGAFRFRTVPTGSYRAFVIPVGGTVATDTNNITIGTRTLDGAIVGDSVFTTLNIP